MTAIPRVSAGLRGPAGAVGPATEWRVSGGYLQFRAAGSSDSWTNLDTVANIFGGLVVGGVFTFKGQVANSGALPSSGNAVGDTYLITGTANTYSWDGASWVGPTSVAGPAGADGADGAAGPGVPSGGTVGQYPRKASGTNYDVVWADFPAIPTTWTDILALSGAPAVVASGADAAAARQSIGAFGSGDATAADIGVNTDGGLVGPNLQLAAQNLQDRVALLESALANLTIN